MAAPSASPVPPSPPATPPPAAPDAPVPRRTQAAALALLVLAAGLIGWRWYADHHGTRPTDLHRDLGHRVDLNRATKAELMQIPGVGPALADRIVAHRDARGKFASVEELRDVHGVGDATLGKLRPWMTVHPADADPEPPRLEPDRLTRKPAPTTHTVQKPNLPAEPINLNAAPLEQLRTLPNIGPVLAQRIIEERQKRPFASVDDLRRVSGIGPKRLDALRGLVTVE